MRHLAGFSLTWASIFLAIVAILIGSPALFYITTALIATVGGCHLQAYLSVRGLKLERVAPDSVRVGDLVTIEINVWSLRKIKRTLITVWDNLPPQLAVDSRSPSLPVAPSYLAPVRTQYQFRAQKRGHFRWTGVHVNGTDALGLVSKTLLYETSTAEMTVLPQPLPISVDLPSAAGWGINESESGQNRGAGIEPRGLREYRFGDSLRQIHWMSTARTGTLLVKEFEAGTHAAAGFCIQRGKGTEAGKGAVTTLEQMCGNVAFLAENLIRQGAKVYLPGLDDRPSHHIPQERIRELYLSLADVSADSESSLANDIMSAIDQVPYGSLLYVLCAQREDSLGSAVEKARQAGVSLFVLLYDPREFVKTKISKGLRSPLDGDFAQRLRDSGASVVTVPRSIGGNS